MKNMKMKETRGVGRGYGRTRKRKWEREKEERKEWSDPEGGDGSARRSERQSLGGERE